MKKIAITGATGAIGLALIDKCIEQGTEVYVFVRRDSGRINRIPEHPLVHMIYCALDEMKDFDVIKTDSGKSLKFGLSGLTDGDTVYDIPEPDVFYHFAWMKAFGAEARNDLKTQIKNIEYAIDSVDLAKRLGCRRYIGAGSQAEYGRKNEPLRADTACDPENGYGMAKLAAGRMTKLQCEKQGIEHIWTRVLSVYGPGDGEGTLVMSVIRDALNGKDPECTKAEQIWDYLYSKDAGEAFYALGERGISGKTYVVGSGNSRPLREYIDEISRACTETGGKPVIPKYGAKPYGARQVMHLEADISELVEDTGYRPQTPFTSGIEETINSLYQEVKLYYHSKKNRSGTD